MPRRPYPWFRHGRGWYVTMNGTQISLGKNKNNAFKRFYALMRESRKVVSSDSVAVLFDRFLDWNKHHRSAETFVAYQQRLQWFLDFLGKDVPVSDLKAHHVNDWLSTKPSWSDSTKHGCITAVKRAFNWSVKMGYIESSPVQSVERPAMGKRNRIISEEELRCHTIACCTRVIW